MPKVFHNFQEEPRRVEDRYSRHPTVETSVREMGVYRVFLGTPSTLPQGLDFYGDDKGLLMCYYLKYIERSC